MRLKSWSKGESPVMTVSSTYSPVPSCFAVEAQPSAVSMSRAPASVAHLRAILVMLFILIETPRRHRVDLQTPQQEQDDHDYQHDADNSTGTIAPTAGMWPNGQDSDKHQDHDNKQNGAKTHDLLPCSSTVRAHQLRWASSD